MTIADKQKSFLVLVLLPIRFLRLLVCRTRSGVGIVGPLQSIHRLRFLNADRGGGVVSEFLEFSTAKVDSLPEGLEAVVLTSDLQGVVSSWRDGGANVLVGVEVAGELAELADARKIPALENTGIVFAGDLYSAPAGDKRGATGDVREAFSELNRWVVGVPGNHDLAGPSREREGLEGLDDISI